MKSAILSASLVLFAAVCAPAATSWIGDLGGKPTLHTEPGALDIRNLSLKSCVSWAYNVKEYQVSGPGWIEVQRYTILAQHALQPHAAPGGG